MADDDDSIRSRARVRSALEALVDERGRDRLLVLLDSSTPKSARKLNAVLCGTIDFRGPATELHRSDAAMAAAIAAARTTAGRPSTFAILSDDSALDGRFLADAEVVDALSGSLSSSIAVLDNCFLLHHPEAPAPTVAVGR